MVTYPASTSFYITKFTRAAGSAGFTVCGAFAFACKGFLWEEGVYADKYQNEIVIKG
jgi:hypothetical protein